MKTILLSMLAVGVLGSGIGVTYAADPMAEKEASPTVKERLTKDTIKGTLMNIEGNTTPLRTMTGNSIGFMWTRVPSWTQ